MFRDRGALERIYPALVHHAVMSFGAEQVMRYMGRGLRVRGQRSSGDGSAPTQRRGTRQALAEQEFFEVLRQGQCIARQGNDQRAQRLSGVAVRAENAPSSRKQWRVLRRSVADFSRRAEVSRKATDRYLTALAAVEVQTPLAQDAAQVCRAVRCEGRRYRALNPLGKTDAELLTAVDRGEFAINGFRNRDVRARLYRPAEDKRRERQQMAAVGRKLRLLRGHGLIAKVSKTHRYVVTEKGQGVDHGSVNSAPG